MERRRLKLLHQSVGRQVLSNNFDLQALQDKNWRENIKVLYQKENSYLQRITFDHMFEDLLRDLKLSGGVSLIGSTNLSFQENRL